MPEVSKTQMGGTMRLGKRRTVLQPGCLAAQLYGDTEVDERHRHRYEVNIDKVPELEAKGLKFVGRDTTGERMEVIELDDHPYYVGTQYHPEFLSRPGRASPPFLGLLLAASGQLDEWKSSEEAKDKFRVEDPFAENFE
jgi:CTP synthase